MFSVFSTDTISGQDLAVLPCTIESWGRVLNGTDSYQVDLVPGEGQTGLNLDTKDWFRQFTDPVRRSLVVCWSADSSQTAIPIVAGPVWTRQWDGTKVTITGSGLRSLLKFRKLLNWSNSNNGQTLAQWIQSGATPSQVQAWAVNAGQTWSALSYGTMAALAVQVATDPQLLNAALPIIYPPVETSDVSHQATVNGFDLQDVGTFLDNLTGLENGPDIDFEPKWADSSMQQLQWVMRVGTEEDPNISDDQVISLVQSVPGSPIQQDQVLEDGSTVATQQWAKGSGSDVNMLLSAAEDDSQGLPAMAQEADYTDVSVPDTLDQHVLGDLANHATPTTTLTLTVDGLAPDCSLGSFPLGCLIQVHYSGHVWMLDGDLTGRIVGISGDNTPFVKLDIVGA